MPQDYNRPLLHVSGASNSCSLRLLLPVRFGPEVDTYDGRKSTRRVT